MAKLTSMQNKLEKCIFDNQFKYSFTMQKKLMKKYLIRNSFLLFVIYMLSSIFLVSVYDNSSWDIIAIRSFSIGFIALMVFITNANIIIYFKAKQLVHNGVRNLEKKIFVTGYIATLVLFILHHFLLYILKSTGLPIHLPKVMEESEGWKTMLLFLYLSLIQYTFIYLIQNFTLSQYEKNTIEVQLLKLKSSNAETTNELLKQQIHPHFLFNALNTLKSLIRKNPDTAEDYLIRLSDFLRASFANQNSKMSTIQDELIICNNYMEMQKIRFGATINYEVSDAVVQIENNKLVPVFSIQPLLENAIKHNIATISKPLHIEVNRVDNYITVTNNLQVKKSIEDSTGKGLSNLKSRYNIISGDEVLIEESETHFCVKIKLIES